METWTGVTGGREARRLKAGAVILCLLLLSACGLTQGQLEATRAFSSASEKLGDAAAREIPNIRQQVVEMNATRIALDSAMGTPRPAGDLDQAADLEDVAVRVKAAKLLKNYGTLLYGLASDSQKANLQKAADSLANAVDGLPEDYRVAGSDALGAAGKVVAKLGLLLVESKKAEAIKEIVATYADQVKLVAGKLRDDLDTRQGGKFASQLVSTQSDLATVARKALNAGTGGAAAAQALVLVQNNTDRAKTVLAQASEAADKAVKAHEALEEALSSNRIDLSAIKAFGTSVETLDETI